MKLPVNDTISLTEFRPTDKADCVARIADREIYRHTLRIPHPYLEEHFDQWMEIVAATTAAHGEPINFAIREDEALIGGIGFEQLVKGHKAEIGYWLAKEWWGRGIMTAVVNAACVHARDRWQLVRITAHVFEENVASARVLEKNGFRCEGLLGNYYRKDGALLNSRLFAKLY